MILERRCCSYNDRNLSFCFTQSIRRASRDGLLKHLWKPRPLYLKGGNHGDGVVAFCECHSGEKKVLTLAHNDCYIVFVPLYDMLYYLGVGRGCCSYVKSVKHPRDLPNGSLYMNDFETLLTVFQLVLLEQREIVHISEVWS